MSQIKEEKLYVYIALFFGIIFVFLTPPFQSPDEDSHFKKAYQISRGNFYPTVKDNKKGNYFPKEMLIYIDDKLSYIGDRDKKYLYSEMVMDQHSHMNYDDKKFNNYSTNSIIPIVYTAPAIGILFSKISAKIFGLEMISTAYMLYFARIFCLIFSIVVTYFAIKTTPVFKKTFAVVALIPMSLYLGSMVTYDNVLDSLILLALSFILKISYDKKIEKIPKSYIGILIIIGVILLNVKTVYFLVFLMMFSIPVKKFKDRKGMFKMAAIIIAFILGITLLLKLPLMLQKVVSESSSLASKQLSFVLNNPFKYLKILLLNIYEQRYFQLSSMICLFGLVDTYVPIPIIFMAYIYLVVIALMEGSIDKIKISRQLKITGLIFILLAVFGIYSAMYISWTPLITNKVGGDYISGVQGRYFLPLIMPVLLLFSNTKIKDNKFFKLVKDNYIIVPIMLLGSSIIMILLRYWV